MSRQLAAEFVGTFFLVLLGPGAVMVEAASPGSLGPVGVALAFAFAVTAMVYVLSPVSGAHINPAVSLTAWARGRLSGGLALSYVIAQCAGATTASFLSWLTLGSVGSVGATVPTIPVASAFGAEWLLSFLLMLVIAETGRAESSSRASSAIAIGLTVGCCALVGGPLTGASMNPARSLGPAVVSGVWTRHWVYWLGPIFGMLSAARLSQFLHSRTTIEPAGR